MESDDRLAQELEALKRRLSKIEALEGARGIFSEYSLYADLGQWNNVAALFSDHATLQIVGYGNYAGINYDGEFISRNRIIKYYDEVTPDVLPKNKHNIIPKIIIFDGSGEFRFAYLIAYLVGADNQAGGLYEVLLKRHNDDSWRFLKLRCVNTSNQSVADSIIGLPKFLEGQESESIQL